jgi:signal transduction histidine kinase
MMLNPLRTLVGRMMLVTAAAVALSSGISFAIFYFDRGTSVREEIEAAMADEIAYAFDRIAAQPADERAAFASSLRGFGVIYQAADTPTVAHEAKTGEERRIARTLAQRLGVAANVDAEKVRIPSHMWRSNRNLRLQIGAEIPQEAPYTDREDPIIAVSDVNASIPLEGRWINARFWAPAPLGPPLLQILAGVLTVLAIGAGAALVARQLARPLRDLARAARALGAGQTNAAAPVHGPEDVRGALIAFNAMSERLSRQMTRQRQMLWALSHDLRTPITALRLRAELVEDENVRARMLSPIAEMESLTEQALALARAGASEQQRVVVDVAEIARTLCGELHDLGWPIRAEAQAPVPIECRPDEIARALRNLIENAAKYGGGGVMHVREDGHDRAIIEVIDDGPGVSEHMLARLAEPFFRADAARSDKEGAGLGLSIAQAIADSHGGRLILANRAPRGFSAKLMLPR